MSNNNTGGPAFPSEYFDPQLQRSRAMNGMTLRDYFAAKAMQGELAAQTEGNEYNNLDALGVLCYRIADAMLAARSNT